MSSMDFAKKKKIVCGVMIFLFVTLLCLVTNLFSFYKNFLLGFFGLVTFPAITLGIVFCILFLANKVVRFDKKSLILSIVIFALFLCILQLALTSGYQLDSMSAYLAQCYESGTTPGGLLLGIVIYPVRKLLFDAGAYVVFSIATVVLIAYMIDSYIFKHKMGQRGATIQKRTSSKKDPIIELRENVRQTPKSFANEQNSSSEIANQGVKTENEEIATKIENVETNKQKEIKESSENDAIKESNDRIKAKLGLIQGSEIQDDEEEVDEEIDNKSEAFRTLYPDKYKTNKSKSSLNSNYLSNSLNRYFDDSANKKRESDEYKEKYKEYTNQKVEIGYDYVNDAIVNTNPNNGIISGDSYKADKKSSKAKEIFDKQDREKANEMFETMKEPPKHYNTEEIHYKNCTIMRDVPTLEDETFDEVDEEESGDYQEYDSQNQFNSSSVQTQNDDNVTFNNDLKTYNENSNSYKAVEENKEIAKPILKVDDEDSIDIESVTTDFNENKEENPRATILPNSDSLAINTECESENEINDDKLIDDFEEIAIASNMQEKTEEVENQDDVYSTDIQTFEDENEDEIKEEFDDHNNDDEGVEEEKEDAFVEPKLSSTNEDEKPTYKQEIEQPKHVNTTMASSMTENKAEPEIEVEEVYVPPKPYKKPPIDFLTVESTDMSELVEDTEHKSELLEQALENFRVPAKVSNVVIGPTVTRYEMTMPAGISVKKIVGYSDDIAMTLASRGAIRIEAPIPGKNAVGIEVPNDKSAVIGFKEVFESGEFDKSGGPLSFVLGKDISGKFVFCNIAKAPHLIVAGSTGSGKSVCLNILLLSIIYKSSPEDVRIVLVDPKRVEFANYAGLPHLMIPQIITEPDKTVNVLQWAINEMERRYTLFQSHRVRDIGEYNSLDEIVSKQKPKMPYIVMILDEFADLMSAAKKEIEDKIARLAAKARSAGIHLVIATQRPSVDVITGTIKNNFPTRIAFSLTTAVDSKTVLDQGGAEKLLGHGDMLYFPQNQSEPTRIQAPFVTGKEIDEIVDYVKSHNEAIYDEKVSKNMLSRASEPPKAVGIKDPTEDDMFVPALRCFIESNQASSSFLQRRLGIGWNRASKLTDAIEELGYISRPDGNNKRQILITKEQFRELYGDID